MQLASLLLLAATPVPGAPECEALLARYARAGFTGAVVVARGGEIVLARGCGLADGARRNDERTLFEIASASKQFTAAAVLKLEQQEKLSLDDPIREHLPAVPAHSRAITIRHLLNHTSGLPRSNDSGTGEDLAAAVAAYLEGGPRAKPGSRFEYWNGGYALLAGVVERASGVPFAAYCERELFAPAGMRDTGFTGDADLDASRAAIGRPADGRPRSALEHPYRAFDYGYRGMGGVVTTALDLFAWDRALAGTAVLGERAKQRLFEPAEQGYACGWWVARAEVGGWRHWHGGSVRGFVCDLRRLPADGAFVAVLENADSFRAAEVGLNLELALFGKPPRHAVPESVELPEEELARCAGTYAGPHGRAVVRVDEGALVAGIEGRALLAELVRTPPGSWKADLEALEREAVALVDEISRGEVGRLRARMNQGISARWPDDVRETIWPRYAEGRGELARVRSLGARADGQRAIVVLALDHAVRPGRARIEFSKAGLEILAWDGPEYPALLRLLPQGDGRFRALDGRRFDFVRPGAEGALLRGAGVELRRGP